MFKMLLNEENKVIESFGALRQDKHQCCEFGRLHKGSFQNLTEKIHIKYLPASMNELKGRRKDMFDLIQNITSG